MSSSASTPSDNNNKEASVSLPANRPKQSTPKLGSDVLAEQKVSTSSAPNKSSTDSAAATSNASTTTIPMKSQEEIASITETEETNTSPAPSTISDTVESSKQDTNPVVTTTLTEIPESSIDPARSTENDDRFLNGIGIDDSGKQRGTGRPMKKSLSPMSSTAQSAPSSSSGTTSAIKNFTCAWCSENKLALKYVLPTLNGDKEFCTELCIAEFRKALKKGACNQCGNVVRPNVAPNRDYCSTFCMNKVQSKISGRYDKAGDAVSSTTNFNGSSIKRNSSPITENHQLNRMFPIFDWDSYLLEKNSVAAPASCFKQAANPPTNYFEANMKLEALDPRCVTSTCIGTVIRVVGSRILIRLDGSDNQNDFWRLVDSAEIHEIGHCERHGGMLQPPLSYTKSVNGWQTFLVKQLKNAILAPDRAFRPEPATPKANMFKVGHKLEAVDKKNPHMICVASVGAVKDDQILVTFDGWRSSSDFWTRYDSRDIFPVNWCARSGYPLDPPGERNKLDSNGNKRRSAKSAQTNSNDAVAATTPISVYFHTRCRGGRFINSSRLASKVTAMTYKSLAKLCMQEILTASPDATQLSTLLCDLSGEKVNIVTSVNKNYMVRIPTNSNLTSQGFPLFLRGICGACKACPNLITLNAGPDQCDKCAKLEQKEIEEQERQGQLEKQRLQQQKERQQQQQHQRQELERKRQKEQQQKTAQAERRQTQKRPFVEYDSESTSSQSSTASSTTSSSTKISRTSIDHKTARVSQTSAATVTTTSISIKNTRAAVPVESQSPQQQQQQQQQSSTAVSSCRPGDRSRMPTGPVNEWSIEEVIQFITVTDPSLAIHADLLRKHEIDGIAFLLLNSDMMMKYMNLKLGPALKICNLVSRAKGRPHV